MIISSRSASRSRNYPPLRIRTLIETIPALRAQDSSNFRERVISPSRMEVATTAQGSFADAAAVANSEE